MRYGVIQISVRIGAGEDIQRTESSRQIDPVMGDELFCRIYQSETGKKNNPRPQTRGSFTQPYCKCITTGGADPKFYSCNLPVFETICGVKLFEKGDYDTIKSQRESEWP